MVMKMAKEMPPIISNVPCFNDGWCHNDIDVNLSSTKFLSYGLL